MGTKRCPSRVASSSFTRIAFVLMDAIHTSIVLIIQSVLAGQHCTDYISTSAVRPAPALLHWSAQYATLALIFKATTNQFLLDDSHLSYLGYSVVLYLVPSMGCL
ncbi:hypothetical protein F5888DRAFT_1008232 [Russula emetica]|nr:hypothetical protein F5888DRAFT_1008232 [Russula emetica]